MKNEIDEQLGTWDVLAIGCGIAEGGDTRANSSCIIRQAQVVCDSRLLDIISIFTPDVVKSGSRAIGLGADYATAALVMRSGA